MKNEKLITIWEAVREEGNIIYPHRHSFYELVYYYKGSGRTKLSGKSYLFSPGTFALIAPDSEHEEQHDQIGKVCCVGFSTSETLPEKLFRDDSGRIRSVLAAMLEEASEQPSYYNEMLSVKLRELILELRRLTPSENVPKDFQYVINYISQNYGEKIQMQTLAEQFHLSYDYFQHRFKKMTGLSPQQFLIEKRLTAAAELLAEGRLNCTEIAQRCGFSNSAQLSMLFRRRFGVAPMVYRREQLLMDR